jgi:hypothetical protein
MKTSCGIMRLVVLVRADVSEELSASIFKMKDSEIAVRSKNISDYGRARETLATVFPLLCLLPWRFS